MEGRGKMNLKDFMEKAEATAEFIKKPHLVMIDACNAVREVYESFPEPVKQQYEELVDNIIDQLRNVRTDYVALGSYLLSDATLRLINDNQEDAK